MTAITDLLNALFAVAFVLVTLRNKSREGKLWRATMGWLAAAGFIGFAVHSVVWDATVKAVIWKILQLPMCICVSLFAVLALTKLRNGKFGRDLIFFSSLCAAVYALMFAVSCFSNKFLLIYVIYAASCLIFSIVILSVAMIRDRKYVYLFYTIGLLVQAPGGVLQALRRGGFTLIWEFDFNSIYHLILLLSEILLLCGYLYEHHGYAAKNRVIDVNNA